MRRDIARVHTFINREVESERQMTQPEKGATVAQEAHAARNTRTLTGRVVSDRMDKSVTVLVERQVMHPVIGKMVRRTKKYHAHDEANDDKVGDMVEIEECRPISKTKAWKLARIAERARPE